MVASQSIRVGDLPGMRAFFDAVAALLDTVNAEDVPGAVEAAADRVRAEALGIGDEPLNVTVATADDTRGRLAAEEERLRTAMRVARENPLRVVNVNADFIPEP